MAGSKDRERELARRALPAPARASGGQPGQGPAAHDRSRSVVVAVIAVVVALVGRPRQFNDSNGSSTARRATPTRQRSAATVAPATPPRRLACRADPSPTIAGGKPLDVHDAPGQAANAADVRQEPPMTIDPKVDLHRDDHHQLRRHQGRAQRRQGAAHGQLVRLPGRQGLLQRQPLPPAHHRRASTSCSAVTRPAPAAAAPATRSPDENLTGATYGAGVARHGQQRSPTPTAASSSSTTRTATLGPPVHAVRQDDPGPRHRRRPSAPRAPPAGRRRRPEPAGQHPVLHGHQGRRRSVPRPPRRQPTGSVTDHAVRRRLRPAQPRRRRQPRQQPAPADPRSMAGRVVQRCRR